MDIIVEVEKKVLVNIDGGRGPQGIQGENGKNIELQNSGIFIQWRVLGDVSWTNLIAVADLKGADGIDGNDGVDGREIELQNTGTFIQWRYVGGSWTNLVSIATITGPQGPPGADGDILTYPLPQYTGTVLSFVVDGVYGTIASPSTGNITADLTAAKLGVTNLIVHNSGSAPTFGAEFKKLSGSGNYVISVVNYIFCTYVSATEIIYSINQRT